jgi:beta-lactamase regulating signal transducer with metallopeptidase domain
LDTLVYFGLVNAATATALAIVALVLGRFCRRPAVVHSLWLLVLLKLVTPPLIDIPFPAPESAAVAPFSEPVAGPVAVEEELPVAAAAIGGGPEEILPAATADLPQSPLRPRDPVSPAFTVDLKAVLGVAWLAGALVWFVLAGSRMARFRKLLELAQPAPEVIIEQARVLAQRLGLRRCPEVVLLPGRLAPLLWASGGRALLCLPAGLVAEMSPEAIDTLLAHELAHYRRGDHWIRGLEFLVLGLYWWNPVAWYARARLREAEEQCCDAWVVAILPGSQRQYATALVDTLDYLANTPQAVPASASGLGDFTDLKRRLRMILRGTTPRSLGWAGGVLVLGLAALLPLWPRQAEAQDRTPTPPPRREAPEELQNIRQALEQKMREIEELRARMAATADGIRRRENPPGSEPPGRGDGRRPDDGGRGGIAIHIEVIAPPEAGPHDIEAIVEKLKGALPQGFKVLAQIHRTGERRGDAGRGPDAGRVPAPAPDGRRVPEAADAGRGRPEPPHPGREGGDRIDQLERRLEAVLHELQALKREMHREAPEGPRDRGTPPPGRNPPTPTPPADRSPSR